MDDGNFIYFPLKERIDGAVWMDMPKRERRLSPYKMIKNEIRKKGVQVEIPNRWEKIGDVILLQPFPNYELYGHIVGEAFGKVLNAKTVVLYKGTYGEFRQPKILKLWGDGTETVHIENGIKYKLDVSKIMFSSGNVNERVRMSQIDARDETIVDLFSGIGYFTLPLAKYGRAKKIYACEKNPAAYMYLLENIKLNRLKNVIPLYGDNRKTAPLRIADRVIMGYIRTEKFLDLGFKVLKEKGGVIHYHDTVTTEERDWKMEKDLKFYGKKNGFDVEIIFKKVVKSYAPHIWHVVTDSLAIPKN